MMKEIRLRHLPLWLLNLSHSPFSLSLTLELVLRCSLLPNGPKSWRTRNSYLQFVCVCDLVCWPFRSHLCRSQVRPGVGCGSRCWRKSLLESVLGWPTSASHVPRGCGERSPQKRVTPRCAQRLYWRSGYRALANFSSNDRKTSWTQKKTRSGICFNSAT